MFSKIIHQDKYKNGRLIHQYYRDALSQSYQLPELAEISHEWLSKILGTGDYNLLVNIDEIYLKTNDSKNHSALRLMLMIIFQSNLILDINKQGKNNLLPIAFNFSIIKAIEKLLNLNVHKDYLITSMQILYRIGEYEIFMYLAENNKNIVNSSIPLLKIKAMINSFCENYKETKHILNQLNSNQKNDNIISILDITCDYKLSLKSRFVYDDAGLQEPHTDNFFWIRKPTKNNYKSNRVFISSDESYFYKHVISLIKSIYHTNKNVLYVHLHIYDPEEKTLTFIKNFLIKYPELDMSLSYENLESKSKKIKTIYASRRFISLYFVRKEINNNLIAIDADSLFKNKWIVSPDLNDKNIVTINPFVIPFWERVIASFLFFSKSDLSNMILLKIAKLIEVNLKLGNDFWFLDQLVLSISLDNILSNNNVGHIDINQVSDTNHNSSSLIWQLATDKVQNNSYEKYKEELNILV